FCFLHLLRRTIGSQRELGLEPGYVRWLQVKRFTLLSLRHLSEQAQSFIWRSVEPSYALSIGQTDEPMCFSSWASVSLQVRFLPSVLSTRRMTGRKNSKRTER